MTGELPRQWLKKNRGGRRCGGVLELICSGTAEVSRGIADAG